MENPAFREFKADIHPQGCYARNVSAQFDRKHEIFARQL